MKNVFKTAVVGAVAAVFVASVAVAQQGPGQGRGRGTGPGGPGGRGFGLGPAIMQDLTEQQRQQIRAIHEEGRGERAEDAKLRQQLELELLADAPNTAKIEELKQQVLAAQSDGLTRHITVQTKVAQVLTPEQRAKAREQLAKGPEGRGPRGAGLRGGGPRGGGLRGGGPRH
jgi:Spy/CpxP family protein refolding chaperone